MRLLQTQTGFLAQTTTPLPLLLQSSPLAANLLHTRMSELQTFTLGVGLTAAQTSSAVLRCPRELTEYFLHCLHLREASAQKNTSIGKR